MREPHPVGVVEGVRAAQVALQPVGVGEVQRARVDRRAGRGAARVAGERAHLVPGGEQLARDRRSRVAECAGYHVGLHHASGLAGGGGERAEPGGRQVEQARQRAEPVEQVGRPPGRGRTGQGRSARSPSRLASISSPSRPATTPCATSPGGSQRTERGRGEHVPHRRLRERAPRRQAGADPLAQAGHRVRSADHLGQHGDVAGVEVGLEDRPGGVDELAQRPGPVKQLAVGGHPPGADLLERGHQQVGDRAEVVEDQRLVASGLGRDPPGAGGREPRLAQRGDGGDDRARPGCRARGIPSDDQDFERTF